MLQVLITSFRLQRHGANGGVTLEIHFDKNAQSISDNLAKEKIRNQIRNFNKRASAYQAELNKFLLEGKGDVFEFNDSSFPFRYASGGTLPILHSDNQDFYCLFYREIFPIGWNIANGSADTIQELKDPRQVIRRELSEELQMVNPIEETRFIYEWDKSKQVGLPGFTAVNRWFRKKHPSLNLNECREKNAELKWLEGPDTLRIKHGIQEPEMITNCFININALDFGIEIDRIADISIDDDMILFDGEMYGDVPVGAPIGLFPIDEIRNVIENKLYREFRPVKYFYEADCFEDAGNYLDQTIREVYIPRLHTGNVLSTAEKDAWDEDNKKKLAFDLCPVTRSLLLRYVKFRKIQHKKTIRKK
jgi:hypothetical protein